MPHAVTEQRQSPVFVLMARGPVADPEALRRHWDDWHERMSTAAVLGKGRRAESLLPGSGWLPSATPRSRRLGRRAEGGAGQGFLSRDHSRVDRRRAVRGGKRLARRRGVRPVHAGVRAGAAPTRGGRDPGRGSLRCRPPRLPCRPPRLDRSRPPDRRRLVHVRSRGPGRRSDPDSSRAGERCSASRCRSCTTLSGMTSLSLGGWLRSRPGRSNDCQGRSHPERPQELAVVRAHDMLTRRGSWCPSGRCRGGTVCDEGL